MNTAKSKQMQDHWSRVKTKAEWLGVDKMIVQRFWSEIKDCIQNDENKTEILEKIKQKEQLQLFKPEKLEEVDTAAKIRITAWFIKKIGSVEEAATLVKQIGGVFNKIGEQ